MIKILMSAAMFVALTTNSLAYAASQANVKTFLKTSNPQKPLVTEGFMMDGFNNINDYSFCFTGDKLDVCKTVNAGYAESVKEFHDGGHELMKVFSCTVHIAYDDLITVDVLLENDYDGGKRAEFEFGRCKK